MEKNVAILMADLAGYTALTETHGGISAAETVDKYLHIVEKSIVGDCWLHEQTGDQVMLLAYTANELLATAGNIVKKSMSEQHFLPVHGGLHFGSVLKRNNRYFGAAVNLTARVTSLARPGALLGTRDFLDALDQVERTTFISIGERMFKNVRLPIEVFEHAAGWLPDRHIDPVCKMLVDGGQHAVVHPYQPHIHFCNEACLDIYMHSTIADAVALDVENGFSAIQSPIFAG